MSAVRHAELVIDRGEGVWVFDEDGNRYLDATASLWYANVGHGRREIADAVAAQLAKLEAYSIFGDLANRPALELAERLTRWRRCPRASSSRPAAATRSTRPRSSPAATGTSSGSATAP